MSIDTSTAQQPGTLEQADQLAAQILAIEGAAAYAVTAPIARALAALARELTGRQLLAGMTGATPAAMAAHALAEIAELATILTDGTVTAILTQYAEQALDTAVTAITAGTGLADTGVTLDATTVRVIQGAEQAALVNLRDAALLLSREGADPRTALAVAGRSVTSLASSASLAVNGAANTAPYDLAVRNGLRLLWIAERDACVVCGALSGHLSDPGIGEGFDETATFGPYPAPEVWPPGMPLIRPPRHIHCRCQIVVWEGSRPGEQTLPDRLQHEARRSILKGWSRPSESQRVRLKAAARLLARGGGGLPQSVQEEAARSVARGRFHSRTVPHPRQERHHV